MVKETVSGHPVPIKRSDVVRTVMFRSDRAWSMSLVDIVGPPEEPEIKAVITRMVSLGILEKRRPDSPQEKWEEPHYVVVETQPVKPVPANVPSFSRLRRPIPTSSCSRCGMTIQGKGRHGKSRRGHGQAECDPEMVKMYMSL